MDWPTAAVLIVGILCGAAAYLVPYWAPDAQVRAERTPAIGFHVGLGGRREDDA